MRKKNKKSVMLSVLGLALIGASACGKATSPAPVNGAAPVAGMPNGGVPGAPGGCIPVNQPIPFTFNGVYVYYNALLNSPEFIRIGLIPPQGLTNRGPDPYQQTSYGQVTMSGGMTQGTIQRTHRDGSVINMTMNLPQASPAGGRTAANGAGYVRLSPTALQMMGASAQGCVSGIAINGETYRVNNNLLFAGDVYFYLNGSIHGVRETF